MILVAAGIALIVLFLAVFLVPMVMEMGLLPTLGILVASVVMTGVVVGGLWLVFEGMGWEK